jgi:predicted metal-binding membrane protein
MKPRQSARHGEPFTSWQREVWPRHQRLAAGGSDAAISNHSMLYTACTTAAILGFASACWIFAAHEMEGMNRGVATQLGAFGFYINVWVAMMAAMMLPGAIPAILRRRDSTARLLTATVFAATYIAVWAMVGVAVYVLYEPHGTMAAGVVTIIAGFYELTPMKRYFRERCATCTNSGMVFGLECVGSSIGLMAMLIVLGVMNVIWMAIIAVVVVVQKLLPARFIIDVPVALAIIGLGIVILAAPTAIPGLVLNTGLMPMM